MLMVSVGLEPLTPTGSALLMQSPLEEVHVLGVFDESSSHHDGLETLTVDRPQLHMDQS